MKFLEALSTPGGRSALLAFLWLVLLAMVFTIRMRGIELDPEGRTYLFETSKILLVALVLSLGLGAIQPASKP